MGLNPIGTQVTMGSSNVLVNILEPVNIVKLSNTLRCRMRMAFGII